MKIVEKKKTKLRIEIQSVWKEIDELAWDVEATNTFIDQFAIDLKKAFENQTNKEIDKLKKWKSSDAEAFLNETLDLQSIFEQKFQTKMLSSIIKSQDSLM